MRPSRPIWSLIILSIAAVLVLNAFAGTPTSPLEKMLHVTRVPGWWPLVLAGITGIVLGGFLNRGRRGGAAEQAQPRPATGRKKPSGPAIRGRHAVPRHLRRARQREAERVLRLEDAAARAADAAAAAEEEAARLARAEAASPPPTGTAVILRRLAGMVGWRLGE